MAHLQDTSNDEHDTIVMRIFELEEKVLEFRRLAGPLTPQVRVKLERVMTELSTEKARLGAIRERAARVVIKEVLSGTATAKEPD